MVVVDAGDHTDMGIRCPASDRSTETYSTRCRGVAATDCGATAAAAAAATAELLLARTKGAAAPDDHHARREMESRSRILCCCWKPRLLVRIERQRRMEAEKR